VAFLSIRMNNKNGMARAHNMPSRNKKIIHNFCEKNLRSLKRTTCTQRKRGIARWAQVVLLPQVAESKRQQSGQQN